MSTSGETVSDGGASSETKRESGRLQDGGDCQDTHYVLALDVGTTVMRGHVYDSSGNIRGASSVKVCAGGEGGGEW